MKTKVKFYSENDLGIVTFLPRIKEVLDIFLEDPKTISSVENAIELQNVIKFIEAGIFSQDWGANYIEKVKKVKLEMIKIVAKYFGTLEMDKILNSIASVSFKYRDDFFENFAHYNYAQRISEAAFGNKFLESKIPIRYLLKSQYFARAYPEFLKSQFMINSLNIELFLSNYSNAASEKLYFPDNISKKEWNNLLEEYIDNPEANLNFLLLLENPIKNLDGRKYFNVTPKQRLRIKKRSKEFSENIVSENSGVLANTIVYTERKSYEKAIVEAEKNQEMKPEEAIDRSILNNIAVSAGPSVPQQFSYTLRALIDRNQIKTSHDFASLFKYLCEDFDYFSKRGISILPSYPNDEMGEISKTIGIKTDNSYNYGFYFQTKQQLAIIKIRMLSSLINQWDLRIEDLIGWFFTKYCKEEYDVSWLPLNLPHSDEITENQTSTLFRIEEKIRTQYLVFVEEGDIEKDLVNETSTPSIEQLPSFVSRKYVYLSKNYTAESILYLLFSDQSDIHYISEEFKGENFTDLIISHEMRLPDFYDYQKRSLEYLIENNILEEKDEILRFKDFIKIELLREIYLFGSISYIHASDEEKNTLVEMEKGNLITFSNTLFTKQESDYLNFLLNNKVFDNSWAIRNKYQHDAPIYDDLEQYNNDNAIALLILVIYIVKIDDELRSKKLDDSH